MCVIPSRPLRPQGRRPSPFPLVGEGEGGGLCTTVLDCVRWDCDRAELGLVCVGRPGRGGGWEELGVTEHLASLQVLYDISNNI